MRRALKTIVHVNMFVARANAKTGTTDPCITVKTYKSNDYVHEAHVLADEGTPALKVVYRPDAPAASGSRIFMEAVGQVSPFLHTPLGANGEVIFGGALSPVYGTPEHPVIIEVSKPTITANRKDGALGTVLTITDPTTGNRFGCHEAWVFAGDQKVAELVYQPEDPLSCGARVWVETRQPVTRIIRPDLIGGDSAA